MAEEQINVEKLVARINEFRGTVTNDFKKEIINALNLLNDQNVQLRQLISGNDSEMLSDKADPMPSTVLSMKDQFHSTLRYQNWPFPTFIINYITKNPATSKGYQKMIQSCKHFFIKNPIIVVKTLNCYEFGMMLEHNFKNVIEDDDLENFSSKIWITNGFTCNECEDSESIVSSVIPKLYGYDIEFISFDYQVLSYEEFLLICSNIQVLHLLETVIKYKDGSLVTLEKLVEVLPKIEELYYTDDEFQANDWKNTAKNLIEIPHFSQIRICELSELSESFDIESFLNYAKTKENTDFEILFRRPLSDAFKNRLKKMMEQNIKNVKFMNVFS